MRNVRKSWGIISIFLSVLPFPLPQTLSQQFCKILKDKEETVKLDLIDLFHLDVK